MRGITRGVCPAAAVVNELTATGQFANSAVMATSGYARLHIAMARGKPACQIGVNHT